MKVLATGAFDGLHHAHIWHLEWAARQGSRLIVALTTDEIVSRDKGPDRPFNKWNERAYCLRALRFVDAVVPHWAALETILRVKPQICVRGSVYAGNFPDQSIYEKEGIQVLFSPPTTSSHIHATEMKLLGDEYDAN